MGGESPNMERLILKRVSRFLDRLPLFLKLMTKIKPLGKRVLIDPAAPETKTASGLYVPATAPDRGTIVAVGDEVESLKVGDDVIFPKGSFNIITDVDTNKKYVLLLAADILAIL